MEKINCTICDTPLIDQYCYHCGQRYYGKRLNTSTIFSDILANIFTLERSVFATLIFLVKKPDKVINNYWSGFRNYYQSPGKMLFYAMTVLGIHIALMGKLIMGLKIGAQIGNKAIDISQSIIFLILFITLILLTSILSFIRLKRNFAEHLITAMYMISAWTIIMIPLDDSIRFIFGDLFKFYPIFIFMGLIFTWNSLVYSKTKKWFVIALNIFLQVLVFATVIGAIISVSYIVNPDNVHL